MPFSAMDSASRQGRFRTGLPAPSCSVKDTLHRHKMLLFVAIYHAGRWALPHYRGVPSDLYFPKLDVLSGYDTPEEWFRWQQLRMIAAGRSEWADFCDRAAKLIHSIGIEAGVVAEWLKDARAPKPISSNAPAVLALACVNVVLCAKYHEDNRILADFARARDAVKVLKRLLPRPNLLDQSHRTSPRRFSACPSTRRAAGLTRPAGRALWDREILMAEVGRPHFGDELPRDGRSQGGMVALGTRG